MSKNAAVIVAGGSGKRMGTATKKQFIKLKDKEILAYTIEAFNKVDEIDEIIVVTGKEDIEKVRKEIIERYQFKKVKRVVAGGKERQDSVYNGLIAVSAETSYVMIHDGARPFISEVIIKKALQETKDYKATIVAMPVKDTIKLVDKEQGVVEETPDREKLWMVQTPQTFDKELLLNAYKQAEERQLQVTDDSMIVEAYGHKVHVVLGEYTNIKITTPEDLVIGESILENRKEM